MRRAALLVVALATSACGLAGQGTLNVGYFPGRGEEQRSQRAQKVDCAEVEPPGEVVEALVCAGKEAEAIELLDQLCWELPRAAARVRHARRSCAP